MNNKRIISILAMCASVILWGAVFAAVEPLTVYAEADKSIDLPSGDLVNPRARAGDVERVEVTPEESDEHVENVPRRRARFASDNGYYYNQLSDSDKLFYNAILEASVKNIGPSDEFSKEKAVVFHTGSEPSESLDWNAVLHAIETDHPEQLESIMYRVSARIEVIPKYGIKDYACYVYFKPGSDYTGEELAQMESELQRSLDSFYAGLTLTGDDANKELIIHDALVDAIEYDRVCAETNSAFDVAHTAFGAFVEHSAVCDGYSKAFKMLLNKAGIDSEVVSGLGNGGGHAWNVVRIGDSWYETDVTWDDKPTAIGHKYYFMLAHDYFNLTTADIRSHLMEVPGFASKTTTHVLNANYMGHLEPPVAYGTEKSYRNIKKVYKITYNGTLDKAVVWPESSYTYEGKLLDKPSTAYLYGYSFDNWYSQQTGGSIVSLDGEFQDSSTIYARWIPKDVSVNLVTGLGNTQLINYKFGEAYSTKLPDNLEKEGYYFGGWYLDERYNNKVQSDTEVSNTSTHSLFARWISDGKRNIIYNANGGTVDTESAVLTGGEKYGSLPVPTRTGYDFSGWFDAQEDGNRITADSIVLYDIELYAHWTPKAFRVYFHRNDGSNSSDYKNVYYGGTFEDAISNLGNYEREGHMFLGWFTDQEGGTQITPNAIVTTDVPENLYAHWRANRHTIRFDANGGSVDTNSVTVDWGTEYGELPTPVRYGYNFDGWLDEYESPVYGSNKVERDITLFAKWVSKKPMVELFRNTGDGSDFYYGASVTYNGTYASILDDVENPAREGKTFIGWFTQRDGGEQIFDYTRVTKAESHNLYAHWRSNQYTIVYNANGGTVDAGSVVLPGGEMYGSLPTPTRYGYTFNGWYDSNEPWYRVSATDIVKGNITLSAGWTPIRTTVLFYSNFVGDNGFYQEEYVDYDNTYAQVLEHLFEPINDGYTFLGWFTQATGGNKVTASTVVKSEDVIKLYAHWDKNALQAEPVKTDNNSQSNTNEINTPVAQNNAGEVVNNNQSNTSEINKPVAQNDAGKDANNNQSNTNEVNKPASLNDPVKADNNNQNKTNETNKAAQDNTNDVNKPDQKTGSSDGEKAANSVKKGSTVTVSGATYIVIGENVVELKTAKVSKAGAISIPGTVKISGKTYKVTGIRAKAFRKQTKIKKVTIGKNVTRIGAQAFEGCTALTTVSGGAAVKIIDAKAFNGCKKLKKAPIGAKVTSIGSMAFYNCSSLTGMTIPANVNKLGKQFAGKTPNLKTLTVKTGKLKASGIANKAFTGIGSKTVIKVPKGKTKTYKSIFQKKGLDEKIKIK